MNREMMNKAGVPLWEKYALTINEAADYFHIGDKKLREMIADNPDADYLLRVGARQLIKRRRLEQYLDRQIAV